MIGSMFSGLEGLDLGFEGGFATSTRSHEQLLFNVVWCIASNPKSGNTFKANGFAGVTVAPVEALDPKDFAPVEVILAGLPCQPFSAADK
jgi:DNA (cytosine-5)-methyltransferase 1